VTAFDTFDNESAPSAEIDATPITDIIQEQIIANLVPNGYFEVDLNDDDVPDEWTTADGWTRVADAYFGSYSMKGQGAAKTLYSDKVPLPVSTRDLIISGMAKASGTSFAVAELTTAAPSAAPQAHCSASGNLVALVRLSGGDEVIDLWNVSTPSSPALTGTVASVGNDRSWPFKIYGNYLICGQKDQFLHIYDISNPGNPVSISVYEMEHATGALAALTIRNWIVYACCDDDTVGGWIEVIDISTPGSPLQLDVVVPISAGGDFRYVAIANDLLVFTVDGSGTWISPTGFVDSGASWSDETRAYDDLVDAFASTIVAFGSWSDFLELTMASAGIASQLRIHTAGDADDLFDIDVYDGFDWAHVSEGPYADNGWHIETFPAQLVEAVRVRIKPVTGTGNKGVGFRELDMGGPHEVYVYDVSTPSNISESDVYSQGGLGHIVLQGDYAYFTCDDGVDENKIVILDISTPAVVVKETAIGGSGSPNYTGSDALFIQQGYLINVGTGSVAGNYSVSYWEMSTPALPTRSAVGNIAGDLDAAAGTGGYVFGPDVDNTKLRVIDPAKAADWELRVRFYTTGDVLLETIVAYDGNGDAPFTGEAWTFFLSAIPQTDIPGGATKVDFLCYCNETTGYVYIDTLKAVFDVD